MGMQSGGRLVQFEGLVPDWVHSVHRLRAVTLSGADADYCIAYRVPKAVGSWEVECPHDWMGAARSATISDEYGSRSPACKLKP
jgi:hypothetical protein